MAAIVTGVSNGCTEKVSAMGQYATRIGTCYRKSCDVRCRNCGMKYCRKTQLRLGRPKKLSSHFRSYYRLPVHRQRNRTLAQYFSH